LLFFLLSWNTSKILSQARVENCTKWCKYNKLFKAICPSTDSSSKRLGLPIIWQQEIVGLGQGTANRWCGSRSVLILPVETFFVRYKQKLKTTFLFWFFCVNLECVLSPRLLFDRRCGLRTGKFGDFWLEQTNMAQYLLIIYQLHNVNLWIA